MSESQCSMEYEVYRHKDASDAEFEEISLKGNDVATHYKNLSLGGERETGDNSNAIFSQMVSPKGR